jgi:hypothetical protein
MWTTTKDAEKNDQIIQIVKDMKRAAPVWRRAATFPVPICSRQKDRDRNMRKMDAGDVSEASFASVSDCEAPGTRELVLALLSHP